MHEFFECPTKRKLDAYARKNNDTATWGKFKWLAYYHKYDNIQRENIRSLAAKNAPGNYYKKKFPKYKT